VARHPEVPFWLCVGDIADEHGRYESLGAPVHWIHGNNDNFDAIAAGDLPDGLYHIENGTQYSLETGCRDPRFSDVGLVIRQGLLCVAGLGGTFAPTWYETPAADLPSPVARGLQTPGRPARAAKDDKRRHFVREEVDACKLMRGLDVFMTHEAAKPFRPFPGGRGPDAGKAQINEILRSMQPSLHLFGHHHRFSEQTIEGVRSVGLDLVTRSYLLVDAATLAVDLREIR
jgi:uncharacterized protein